MEFALVGSIVTLLFLAVLQVGIAYHVRNVLAACVAEGARYGANADVASADEGAARANDLIRQALGASYAHARAATDGTGAPLVAVTVTDRLPLLAWFLPVGPVVHATGHALLEPR